MRYAAKLLFQFHVHVDEARPKSMRTCEERIIVFEARTAKEALKKAKLRGHKEQYTYPNDEGNTVSFEFIGIRDMVDLGDLCKPDEVWYDIKTMLNPMERKDQLIPSDAKLLSRT